MTAYNYPHTGYGVELRTKEGWALLSGIHKSRDEAEHVRATLLDQHATDPAELRVVALTITRKEDTE